jgi:hypothetical protein
MPRIRKKILLTGLFLLLPFLLTGCFLRLLFGTVGQRDTDFGIVYIADLGGRFGPTAWCDIDNNSGGLLDCTYYFILSGSELVFTETSSAYLISELGVLGLFIDPVILQVPVSSTHFAGTISDGVITHTIVASEMGSFYADPTHPVLPEAGQKFVLLDFPEAMLTELLTNGSLPGPYDFHFEFELPSLAPVQVKPMYAGKVQTGGLTYYPPMLPCTADFSTIPALTIPVSTSPANLMNQIVNALSQGSIEGCDHQVYNFIPLLNQPNRHYLPLILK